MMCGVNKEYMVQYSFILGIPAIIAANISQTKDAIEIHQSIEVLPTVIGIITAMVVGVLCIKLLQWILKKDMFKYFGYYCIAIGIFTLACQIFKIHF
ncbi:Bacitracin resistance protein BacA [human gut metagenome]|uniref:Undecaprenyl-diphosphatase n=1 Tax=human gut metagenome TaxID=408170 RepID=K1UDR2_9ZZZZ